MTYISMIAVNPEIQTQSETERLTPQGWKHVGIYPASRRGRFDLRGRFHSEPWHDFDCSTLGLGQAKTAGLKLADALQLGGQIESAMEGRGDPRRRPATPMTSAVSLVAPAPLLETPETQSLPGPKQKTPGNPANPSRKQASLF